MQGSRRAGVIGTLVIVAATGIGDDRRGARADLLYFEAGGEAQLPAELDGEVVRVLGPGGPVEFLREDFLAVVPGHWPEREWPERRDRAEAGGAEERYRAAWWALEHGLTPEAVAMLRSAHRADPDHQPVGRLVGLLDRLERPAPAPELSSLRKALPGGAFDVAETASLVLLHQQEGPEVADRLDLLDRVLTTFYLTFSAQGFDLRTPPEKLVAVWFDDEADYLSYIRKEAGEAFLTTRGYYHPTRRVVFFTSGRSRAEDRRAEEARRGRAEELDRAERSLEGVPAGARFRLSISGERPRTLNREGARRLIARLRRDAERDALLRELERIRADGAASVHELVHQAVIASGLAPSYERFPIWLHEGLAMQFEAFRGGRWAGLGEVPANRLDQWRRASPAPPIEPLLRDEGFGRGYVPDRYSAAWALVHFLRSREPEGFVTFLDRLRNPSSGRSAEAGDRVLDAFRAAISPDLPAIRASWIAEMREIRPAIESGTPAGKSSRGPP